MQWNRTIDELPIIPKGKYGIQVIVAEFDPCYDECSPGNGYSIYTTTYGIVDHKKMPMFKGSSIKDGEATFFCTYIGNGSYEYGPRHDIITHWSYMPDAPEYDPEVLNPIFQHYHDHSLPQSPLKQI